MNIALSQQQKVFIDEVVDELIVVKNQVIQLSESVLIYFYNLIKTYIMNLSDFSIENLKKYGLSEILCYRAKRFFNLSEGVEKLKTKTKKIGKKIQKKGKYFIKKTVRIVLFPIYILFVIAQTVLEFSPRQKQKKKGRNSYIE